MKKLLLILTVLLSIYCSSQTQFDYLGGLPVDANSTGCFYIDLNTGNTGLGINDVKFVHGSGEIYFDAVAGDSLRLPPIPNRNINGKKLWQECSDSNYFTVNKVYVISSTNSISYGNHVLPFKYNNLYNYIVVNVDHGGIMKIRGWVFNIPEELFECYLLTDQTK